MTQIQNSADLDNEDDKYYDEKRKAQREHYDENVTRGCKRKEEVLKKKSTSEDYSASDGRDRTYSDDSDKSKGKSTGSKSSQKFQRQDLNAHSGSRGGWSGSAWQQSNQSGVRQTGSHSEHHFDSYRDDGASLHPDIAEDEKRTVLLRKPTSSDKKENRKPKDDKKSGEAKSKGHMAPVPVTQSVQEFDAYRGKLTSLKPRLTSERKQVDAEKRNQEKKPKETREVSKREQSEKNTTSTTKESPKKDEKSDQKERREEEKSERKKSERRPVKRQRDEQPTNKQPPESTERSGGRGSNRARRGSSRGNSANTFYEPRQGYGRGREYVRGGRSRPNAFSASTSRRRRDYNNYNYYEQDWQEPPPPTQRRRDKKQKETEKSERPPKSRAEKNKGEKPEKTTTKEPEIKIKEEEKDKRNSERPKEDYIVRGEPSRRGRGNGRGFRGGRPERTRNTEEQRETVPSNRNAKSRDSGRSRSGRGKNTSDRRGGRSTKNSVKKQPSHDAEEWETASESSMPDKKQKERDTGNEKESTGGKKTFSGQRPPNGTAGNGKRGSRGPLQSDAAVARIKQDIRQNNSTSVSSAATANTSTNGSNKTDALANIDLNNIASVVVIDKLPDCGGVEEDGDLDGDGDFQRVTYKKQPKVKGQSTDVQPPPVKKEKKDISTKTKPKIETKRITKLPPRLRSKGRKKVMKQPNT